MLRNPFRHASPINNPDSFPTGMLRNIGREYELRDILACLHHDTFDSF